MNEYVKSNLVRYRGEGSALLFIIQYLHSRTFRWQVAFRLVNSHGIEKAIGWALWMMNRSKKIFQIPRSTKIGYGLYIGHEGPVIVNETAVIGDNCNLSQFTTIGSTDGAAAVIGDNVYIGPSVCIVENVHIGDNATIGAGSVVTKDIPDNATAAGNYARVLNFNNPGRYVGSRYQAEVRR